MPLRIFLLLFSIQLCFLTPSNIYAQSHPEASTELRGLWVTKFKNNVLGNTSAENSLLQYAQTYNFNYLICTNMYFILTEDCGSFTTEMIQLQAFIEKAHNVYGIALISGNVGSANTADKIKDYNNCGSVTASQKFDMITYECEFYNDATNGSCPGYGSFISQLSDIKNTCEATLASDGVSDLICEVYIGGSGSTGLVVTVSSEEEMEEIAATADHVLLTYYRSTPMNSGGNFFNWTSQRLKWLANPGPPKSNIVLLLKSRDTDSNNMYDYLSGFAGSHYEATRDPYLSWVYGTAHNPSLTKGAKEKYPDSLWLEGLKIKGFTWFENEALQEIVTTLAVDLTSISVKLTIEHSAELLWTTTSEINADHFIVERSDDGVQWQKISKIKAIGNTSSTIDYKHLDTSPLQGTSYYRLSSVDNNEDVFYSEIVSLINNMSSIHNDSVILYPVPASNELKIDHHWEHIKDLSVFNLSGLEINVDIINQERNKIVLDLSGLSPGVYILKLNAKSIKFLVE